MGTNVYIDGFNFFYGSIKGTEHKWLNLEELSQELLRGHEVSKIKFFTASVNDSDDDPDQSQRQHVYLRALGTLSKLEVIHGTFKTRKKLVRLVKPPKTGKSTVLAYVTEEKGTDVSLGAHLVFDACHNHIDAAMVISNDSDLQTPIDMAIGLGKTVIVVNPHRHKDQVDHLFGNDSRKIKVRHLRKCQFPPVVIDAGGRTIKKPQEWA